MTFEIKKNTWKYEFLGQEISFDIPLGSTLSRNVFKDGGESGSVEKFLGQVFSTPFLAVAHCENSSKTGFMALNLNDSVRGKCHQDLSDFMGSWYAQKRDEALISECFASSDFRQLMAYCIHAASGSISGTTLADQLLLMNHCCLWLDKFFWTEFDPSCSLALKKAESLIWCASAQFYAYGLLTPYFYDPSVSEILVNHARQVFIERNGILSQVPLLFPNDESLLALIQKFAAAAGRRIDQAQPYCDAHLSDGSRMHAIIPPLSRKGPCLSVRRFTSNRLCWADLVAQGSVTLDAWAYLKNSVEQKKNILVSGATSTGKTTFLNALSTFISHGDRIVTIEDAAELSLKQTHVVSLESRSKNADGCGEVSIRELVKNALRMRPDRIILGECRGAEAFDVLQAMSTGHDGSMTTVHANSARAALQRMVSLALMAEAGLPHFVMNTLIADAIHVVVHLRRSPNGARVVHEIFEVKGLNDQGLWHLEEVYRAQDRPE